MAKKIIMNEKNKVRDRQRETQTKEGKNKLHVKGIKQTKVDVKKEE